MAKFKIVLSVEYDDDEVRNEAPKAFLGILSDNVQQAASLQNVGTSQSHSSTRNHPLAVGFPFWPTGDCAPSFWPTGLD